MPNPGSQILTKLYYDEDKRLQEIGDEYGVSRERVRQWMEKKHVPRIRNRKHRHKPRPYQSLDEYFQYVKCTGKENTIFLAKSLTLLKKQCEDCGSTKNLNVHHLKYPAIHINDVQLLCASCHHCKHRKGNGHKIQLEICNKYAKGQIGPQLAKAYNVTNSMVYHILRKWNILTRHHSGGRQITQANKSRNKEIAYRYNQGEIGTHLAKNYNISQSYLYVILQRQNVITSNHRGLYRKNKMQI